MDYQEDGQSSVTDIIDIDTELEELVRVCQQIQHEENVQGKLCTYLYNIIIDGFIVKRA